jgi:hypothetical protein
MTGLVFGTLKLNEKKADPQIREMKSEIKMTRSGDLEI